MSAKFPRGGGGGGAGPFLARSLLIAFYRYQIFALDSVHLIRQKDDACYQTRRMESGLSITPEQLPTIIFDIRMKYVKSQCV